jgi:cold shock CspA family protein
MRFGRAKGPPQASGGARTSGRIARIAVGQSYGFIRLNDRREVFFHRADLHDSTPFNSLQIGERVAFELIVDAISGPRAVSVRRHTRVKKQEVNR